MPAQACLRERWIMIDNGSADEADRRDMELGIAG
jgi:hypothetical protein